MMNKKHILCSIDFSSVTPVTVEAAVTLAQCYNAKLTILTVVEQLQMSSMQIDTERERDAYNRLIELVQKYHLDREQIKSVTGYPKEVILNVAKELGADLIVMGSHGHYGITHHLLGSTTRIVANDADCDVYIVRY